LFIEKIPACAGMTKYGVRGALAKKLVVDGWWLLVNEGLVAGMSGV